MSHFYRVLDMIEGFNLEAQRQHSVCELRDLIFELTDRIIKLTEGESYLGNATNEELIDELKTRIEIHWDLKYKTVEK